MFSSEPAPAPATPAVVSHQRKDYNYLKPAILAGDCTRRELTKFSAECRIWLEKSLSLEDRADNRLVWANIRNVIDDEWDQILSRDLKTAEKIRFMQSWRKFTLKKPPHRSEIGCPEGCQS